MSPAPLVIAHRGASGYAAENSLAAFREAALRGADGVELDVHATLDGVLVVHHGPVADGFGAFADHPASHFSSYRLPNGEPLAPLGAALAVLNGLDVWVEVKSLPEKWDDALLATLQTGPTPARYAVHSFDHRIIERLGDREPGLRRGVLLSSYLMDCTAVVHAAGADTLWMEAGLIDAELAGQFKELGLALIAWTVNSEAEAHRLAQLGVYAICGNYPDRIRQAIQTSD
jgi:glycerophosphoryl diester phosphodiesterase